MNDAVSARPVWTSLVLGVSVFILTALVWQLGLLQGAELWVYDHFVAARADAKNNSRFILVLQDETDIAHLDYPLRDSVLADLLEKIEAGGPAVIGLDLYRDLPEPRNGSESAILTKTLQDEKHDNIIAIFLTGTDSPFGIAPPACLLNDPSRYGFNNFPYDYKSVRRAYLSAKLPDKHQYNSFARQIAQYYLATKGIQPTAENHNTRLGKTMFTRFRANDGAYVDADAAGYQFMQDFRTSPHFQTMSIRDVLQLKDYSVFKDKIVLIGSGAKSGNDVYETAVESFASGPEIHAQIIDQLLRAAIDGDRPTESASALFRWFSLAFWCAVGVLAGFRVRSYVLFALTLVLCLGVIVLTAWWIFMSGYWTLVIAPAAGFLAAAMLVKGYAAAFEEEQRSHLMKLFSQHVPPKVAEKIWDQRNLYLQGGRPAAQRIKVTILFTDLRNYSTIAEKMSPANLIAWLNECTCALAQQVDDNGGMISSFMGDGMMAVFGVPVARTDEEGIKEDATNAVRCALSMAREIKTMNARWKAEGKPQVALRVGINTGEAMCGMLGTVNHLEYSVIGDSVNKASRLESMLKDEMLSTGESRIFIGKETYTHIHETFPTSFVGTYTLKGRQEATEVYKVLDQSPREAQSKS